MTWRFWNSDCTSIKSTYFHIFSLFGSLRLNLDGFTTRDGVQRHVQFLVIVWPHLPGIKCAQTCVWVRQNLTKAKAKDVRTSPKSSEFLSTWHLHAVANTRAETQSVPGGFGRMTAVKLCNLLLIYKCVYAHTHVHNHFISFLYTHMCVCLRMYFLSPGASRVYNCICI